jgi:TolB protein
MENSKRERRTSRRVVVTVAFAATLVIASVVPAHATAPGRNGRIAFRRYFNAKQTRGAIFTIRPNGAGLLQVTHRGRDVLDTNPDWSPDGRWIAYYRRAPGEPGRIFKVRPDGTDVTRLSHDPCDSISCVEDVEPAWSPNGRLIAFTRIDDAIHLVAVDVMRPDGTHVRQVTADGNFPKWSPDGTRLAFNRRTASGKRAVFTIRLDGTHARRLTPGRLKASIYDWSPDGRWILVESGHRQRNVYLVHPDGTDLHRVTDTDTGGESNWGGLSFSPDGTLIAASFHPGAGGLGNPDIWVMNLDGSGLRDVTNSAIWDSAPDWGPRPSL